MPRPRPQGATKSALILPAKACASLLRAAVIGRAEEVGAVARAQLVAVDKIGVGPGRDPGEDRVRGARQQLVPAEMRDLEAGVARRDADNLARDPAQPLDGFELAAALG